MSREEELSSSSMVVACSGRGSSLLGVGFVEFDGNEVEAEG